MNQKNENIFQLLWKTSRPRQWIKSSFLFAPALFTLQILDIGLWKVLILGAVGFSLIASSVYTFNDIINLREDKNHPQKRSRPLASGTLSIRAAALYAVFLLISGSFLLYQTNLTAFYFGLSYFALMFAYTIYLRRLFLIDVIIIAIGFVLRVETGASLINEPVSRWILLCTFTIALFLVLIKRREEIQTLNRMGIECTREVLNQYPELSIVDNWISVIGGMAILSYALYTLDAVTIAKHNTSNLIYTFPFVIYGIFRYRTISLRDLYGEDPAELILKDFGIKTTIVLWVTTVGLILFFAR